MKIINNFTMMSCNHCHTDNLNFVQDESGCELRVCYHCGSVEATKSFDALDYIKQLMHEDITKEKEIVELLADKLSDEYYWLEFLDVELMAELIVKELYDEALFTVQAEQEENSADYREVETDYCQMVLGAV